MEDGRIYCLVERDAVSEVDGITFDLTTTAYHLLIASGSTAKSLSIGEHGPNRVASRNPILFTENPEDITEADPKLSRTLLLLHGSFMIVSWIGTSIIGVFAARYFKTIWRGNQIFGKDIWFFIHQASMSTTWVLTISAVIIIWIDLGEWKNSAHSLLGIITTSLCFIQPFAAFFRPKPTDEARPISNFMHALVVSLNLHGCCFLHQKRVTLSQH